MSEHATSKWIPRALCAAALATALTAGAGVGQPLGGTRGPTSRTAARAGTAVALPSKAAEPPSETRPASPGPSAAAGRRVKIEKGVRLRNAGTPGLYVFGRRDVRVYYNSQELGFATATTRNGKKFRHAESIDIEVADSITADASVILWQGALRLFFKVVPLDDPTSHRVWRATANDDEGTDWTIDGRVFKRTGKPCFDWTSVPHAVVTHDGRVRLYFVCSMETRQIATAISNNGKKFKFEQVVLQGGVDPYVLPEGDGYRMFYAGAAPDSSPGMFDAIYSAVSADGINWSEGDLLVTAAQLGASATIDPAAYEFRPGRYRVYVPAAADLANLGATDIYSLQYKPPDFLGRRGR